MKTNKQLALAVNAISDDLEDRIWKLAEILMKDLQNPALKKSESRTVILYLSRLGFSKKAREIFLDTRSQKINNEIKYGSRPSHWMCLCFFCDAANLCVCVCAQEASI
jgi:hypothetical protein